MKNKILSIFLIFILTSFCFIGNSVLATTTNNTITAVCNTSNPHNGETLTYILPENMTASSHVLVCWSGIYGKWCLYVARNWSDNTVFRLDSTYKYLFAYDKKSDTTYDFDVYVYQSGTDNLPTFDKTAKNLYWNGLIYENGGLPNISVTTDDVYFADNSLCNVASSDVNFFFPNLMVAPALEKVEMTQEITTTIVGLAKYLIPLLICLLGFWKAWQILSHSLHKA